MKMTSKEDIQKQKGIENPDGFYVLEEGGIYDPNGYYFDKKGFEPVGVATIKMGYTFPEISRLGSKDQNVSKHFQGGNGETAY